MFSVETGDRIAAVGIILTTPLKAFPVALQILQYEYKGKAPMRLDAWVDAIEAAYLVGF